MYDMKQVRVEVNQHGNMYIYVRDVPFYGTLLECCIALRQWNGREYV